MSLSFYKWFKSHHNTIIALLLFVFGACGKAELQEATIAEEWDFDSIPLHDYSNGPKYNGRLVEFELNRVIGGNEQGEEWQLFAIVSGLLVGPDGCLLIGDGRRSEIYIVDPDGQLIKRIGGEGSGPGEFQALGPMFWAEYGQEFWVNDIHLLRMSRFSADGELIDTFNTSKSADQWNRFYSLGDYRFIGERFMHTSDEIRVTGFGILDGSLKLQRMLAEYTRQSSMRTDSGRLLDIPFQGPPLVRTFLDGRVLIGNKDGGYIVVCDSFGNPQFRIEKAWPISRISAADIKNWKDLRGRNTSRADLDQVPIPQTRPPFADILTDDRGWIWVQHSRPPRRSGDEEQTATMNVDIFDAHGQWLATQTIPFWPMSFMIHQDYLYFHPIDPEDGPRVERYRMIYAVPIPRY